MSDSTSPSAGPSAADAAPCAPPVPVLRWRMPRWRPAFLRALGRYGNVRLAAEAAGVDKTVCYTRRRADPGFAAAWERAKARAAERLRATELKPVRGLPPGVTPGGDWSRARGDAGLVVFGGHGFTPPRLQRPRRWGWSAAKERVFFQTLADTCNVSAAARAVGMSKPPIYQRRKHDQRFARDWQAALDNGMLALEARLIQTCCDMLEGNPPPPCFVPGDAPLVDIASAIHLWSEHRKQQAGTKRRGWTPAPLPSIEHVQAEIGRKVAAVRKHGVGKRRGGGGGGAPVAP